MADNPLRQLTERGQSIWLDFIDRELVTGDRLAGLIADDCVTGMTSNPTIFEKAIAERGAYDEQLRALVGAGMTDPEELFVELAVSDIQRAADTLRPAFDGTGGRDGFVSIEVAPRLADDTTATIAAAKYLWGRVERPNLMVKVPATPAGLPALEELIAGGLNINVTLIFALSAYEEVAQAYVRALERRDRRGESLHVRSVASFFVSRVDTAVDKLIEEKLALDPGNTELRSLLGTAAIANAVLAYEKFEEIFHGERFAALREKGAAPQRCLWASTSAKNPKYRDVVYAEALIGPDTIDTMPPSTLQAFADHGVVAGDTVNDDYADAHRVMERLANAGIDMEQVTQHLLEAGVKSFGDSYTQLVRTIAMRADAFTGGFGTRQHLDLGASAAPVLDEAANQAAAGMVRRIWERDPDLWKPGDADHAKVIRNRLGWLDVVELMREAAPALSAFAAAVRDEGVRDVVLLGMGGSSLCPEVLRSSFGSAAGYPTLHVLDTTDPAAIRAVDERVDPHRALFVVSSKSGGTLETLSHMAHYLELTRAAGLPNPGSAFVCVTDPGTSLAETARQHGFRRVFENPPDIGGRYSALSYFGMVPAALAGIDTSRLLDRGAAMLRQCSAGTFATLNCGLVLGTAMGLLHDAGRDKATIVAPAGIGAFGLWAEQLIAESTGKEGKGIIPIGAEPLGAPGVYADDRLFIALRLGVDAEYDAALGALRTAGQPVMTIDLADLYDLGAEFVRWEFATAVAGAHLQIDPFDEPNVTESKENTRRLLATLQPDGTLPPAAPPGARAGVISVYGGDETARDPVEALRRHLASAAPGDYVALMAYVTPDEANEAALQELRVAIRDTHCVATTFGFGPRFLHSTGQLHKGGPGSGVYVQVTVDDAVDVDIPGQPFSFSVLKQAQAQGDLESLRNHGRRVLRVHVGGDPADLPEVLRQLAAGITEQVGAAR